MKTKMLLPALLCLLVLSAMGCNKKEGATTDKKTIDFQLVESLRLGSEDGPEETLFGRITRLAIDTKGRVYVSEARHPAVKVFSSTGDLVTLIGRGGEGPGEFRRVSSIVLGANDTLFVYDGGSNRISIFEPDSFALIQTIPLTESENGFPQRLLGESAKGFVFESSASFNMEKGLHEVPVFVERYDRQGILQEDSVVVVRGTEFLTKTIDMGFNFLLKPFYRSSTLQATPNGRIYYGWNGEINLQIVDADGQHLGHIQQPHTEVPVTAKDLEEYGEIDPEITPEKTKPAFITFLVDDQSRAWVQLSSHADSLNTTWQVLAETAGLIGSATLPKTVTLMAVQKDKGVGVDVGTDGANYLVVYQVKPSEKK